MVYYLRPRQSFGAEEAEQMMSKYGPAVLYSLGALAFSLIVCYLLAKYCYVKCSYICMKDQNGDVVINKHNHGKMDNKKAWMISGIVSLVVLAVSAGVIYKKDKVEAE